MTIASHGNPFDRNGKGFELAYNGAVITKPLTLNINNGTGYAQQIIFHTHQALEGGWHHVAFTLDRDQEARLYIDGIAVKALRNPKPGNIAPSTEFRVGSTYSCPLGECGPFPSTSWFDGKMDDVKVYHQALSPSEISNLYQNDTGGTVSYDVGANNQLTSTETHGYQYDAEGNRTLENYVLGNEWDASTWDHRNRLTQAMHVAPREKVHYAFESDEGDRAVDELGHALEGYLAGDVYLTTAGNSQQSGTTYALDFDGNGDYVALGIQDVFSVKDSGFSLLAWIQPQATTSVQGIVGNGEITVGNSGYRLYYVGTAEAEKLIFQLNDGVGTMQQVTYNVTGSSLQNAWHHVGVTIDPASSASPQIRLYLDGVEKIANSLTQTNGWNALVTEFTIGALGGGTTGYFNGMLDDIRIADVSLPVGEFGWAKNNNLLTMWVLTTVNYTYDHQNRLISRELMTNHGGAPSTTEREFLIQDGPGQSTTSARLAADNLDQVGQIVLRLTDSGNVTGRYLWGAGVDQLLAQELSPTSSGGTTGGSEHVYWVLTDHLGTVRDLVRYNPATTSVESVVHRAYDSFGNVTSEVNTSRII